MEGTAGEEMPSDKGAGQTNDNPTGRQKPAVSLEWIGPPIAKVGQPLTYQILIKNVTNIAVHQVVVRANAGRRDGKCHQPQSGPPRKPAGLGPGDVEPRRRSDSIFS